MKRALYCTLVLTTSVARADDTGVTTTDKSGEPTDATVTTTEHSDEQKPDTTVVPELRAGSLHAQVFGSLRPMLGFAYHGDAVPADRWAYGVSGSSVDLGADARAAAGLSASFYVSLASERDAEGRTVGVASLERAVVGYEPIKLLSFSIGRDPIPLTAQSATPTIARVFPSRLALDETFVLPADVGLQARLNTNFVTVYAGAWNGIASDVMLEPGATERGLLYSTRVEATPLGAFDFNEDARPSALRIGIGLGLTYRAATAFTPIGQEGVRSRDLRAALAVRTAWRGVFVQGELLRKQVTDDLSMRPDVATGAYVQASVRVRTRRGDFAPLARTGIVRIRQLSTPATGSSVELGAAVFPFANGSDRLQISTLFSRVVDPDLHGAALQAFTELRLAF